MSEAKTVRVRIAVAVNAKGEWNAIGSHDDNNELNLMWCAAEPLAEGPFGLHWVEATLPLPTETTVEGTVTG